MSLANLKKVLWPALILGLLVWMGWPLLKDGSESAKQSFEKVLHGAMWIAVGITSSWLSVRLIDLAVWQFLEHRIGTSIPRLLKDIVAALVCILVGIIILKTVFNTSVTGIWATSGVIGIVLGFALQSMIADVFYGIAINVDQPFKIGQWVEVHPRGVEPMIGCVTEISWRSTRLRTIDNTVVVMPNSQIGTILLKNLSEPDPNSRFDLTFTLDFDVPTERALRVLNAGVKSARGILAEPEAKARLDQVCERGVQYKVRYWLNPVETSPAKGRHAVIESVLRHLHQAGLTLAYKKHDVFHSPMPVRQLDRHADRATLIKRIEIFSSLAQDEIDGLAQRISERRFFPEDPIVRQGDPGNSMFVLVEGLLEVRSNLDNGMKHVKVKALQPGEFFGEMSLLTGEPRTATVAAATDSIVYEIGKEDLDGILSRRPEIAIQISEIVAKRKAGLAALEKLSPEEKVVAQQSFANQVLEKMKSVFSCLREGLAQRSRVAKPAS